MYAFVNSISQTLAVLGIVTRIMLMFNCLFIYLFYFLQTFQLTDELQTFSAEVRDASVDSLEKSLTSYHVVSVVVEGILALCKEVSVLFLSASDVLRPISYQVWEKRRHQAFSRALHNMLNFSLSSVGSSRCSLCSDWPYVT